MTLTVNGLGVDFWTGQTWRSVVTDLDMRVEPGEVLGIVGESGSGKSVSAMAMLGLLPPNARVHGSVALSGKRLDRLTRRQWSFVRGKRITMIFQEPLSSFNFAFTIGDQLAEPARRHLGLSRRDAWSLAVEWLERVGIRSPAQKARDYPHQFSGGMLQRVMIAMALICEPRIVIADEPTTALDVTTQARVLDLLKSMQVEYGLGMVFISHDLAVVSDIADRLTVMYAGQAVESGPVEDVFMRPQHPYTEGLIASSPALSVTPDAPAYIRGSVPDPGAWPRGCRFHPRCGFTVEGRCDVDSIALSSVATDRVVRCVRWNELALTGVGGRKSIV